MEIFYKSQSLEADDSPGNSGPNRSFRERKASIGCAGTNNGTMKLFLSTKFFYKIGWPDDFLLFEKNSCAPTCIFHPNSSLSPFKLHLHILHTF